ncbi:hypothetical protein TNIN_274151 [Trichonephila inaurata madagascariensis]|uniref:Uncharacterized protein n=1 Tax=Trichonephila inaurata madagascariensis TaxID=2747483 RepID=A0A8X6XA13_9ARAC|nr:hypothetical protein TNIN_274151 [Trichonephila inaurata madagascariensis]
MERNTNYINRRSYATISASTVSNTLPQKYPMIPATLSNDFRFTDCANLRQASKELSLTFRIMCISIANQRVDGSGQLDVLQYLPCDDHVHGGDRDGGHGGDHDGGHGDDHGDDHDDDHGGVHDDVHGDVHGFHRYKLNKRMPVETHKFSSRDNMPLLEQRITSLECTYKVYQHS